MDLKPDAIWIFACFITSSLTVDVSSVMEQTTESLAELHRPHHLCRSTLRVSSIKSDFSDHGSLEVQQPLRCIISHLHYGKPNILFLTGFISEFNIQIQTLNELIWILYLKILTSYLCFRLRVLGILTSNSLKVTFYQTFDINHMNILL